MPPPSRTLTMDTLYTNTWWERMKKIEDVVFQKVAVLYLMTKKTNMVNQVGGPLLECPVEYGINPTVAGYGRGDQVSLADVEIDTVARYAWARIAGSVTRFWTDEQENQGKYAIKRIVNRNMDNLEKAIRKHADLRLFTLQSGKEIMSILDYVQNDPTAVGTIGGLDQVLYAWWRNYYRDCAALPMATYLRDVMETMWNTIITEGQDTEAAPDAFITTQTVKEEYAKWGFDMAQARVDDLKLVDLGVGDTAFHGRPVIFDVNCPSGRMFALNFSSLFIFRDPTAWFQMTDWKTIPDQLDKVAQNVTALQVACSNRKGQGVVFGLA